MGNAHFRRAGLLLQSKTERMLEHFGDARVLALAEPFYDRLFPDIGLVTYRLLSGSESFQFGRLQPPFPACFEAHDGFGPELIAVACQRLDVDHALARHWPNSPCTGRVLQVATDNRIDAAGKHALPWSIDRMFAKRRPVAIEPSRN